MVRSTGLQTCAQHRETEVLRKTRNNAQKNADNDQDVAFSSACAVKALQRIGVEEAARA